MGWFKVAVGGVAVSLGFALVFGCGGADGSHSAEPAVSAGSAGVGGGASGAPAVGGSSSGSATAGHDAGGSATSGGSAAAATTSSAGGPANIFVDQLRGASGCLPRSLPTVTAAGDGFELGQARCAIGFATFPIGDGGCACDASQKLKPASVSFAQAITSHAKQNGSCDGMSGVACSQLCACELEQCKAAALTQCQSDATTPIAQLPPGFCYVDLTLAPPLGSPDVVADCGADSRRTVRILGKQTEPPPLTFLGCW
jgi:hypothetical protein